MSEVRVPVLIVGAGGCGLSLSLFLSNLGIESLLVEQYEKVGRMPKARVLNQRAMEAYRHHGFANEVYSRSYPGQYFSRVRYQTSLGGDGPIDRKTLHLLERGSANVSISAHEAASPCPATLYPQFHLEPLLRKSTEGMDINQQWYGHELVELWQDDANVHATVLNRATGEKVQVIADYLVGTDGGRTVGGLVDAQLTCTPTVFEPITIYFKADLSEWITDDHAMSYHMINGEGGAWGSGTLAKAGEKNFDRHSEEWQFYFHVPAGETYSQEFIVDKLLKILKLPDLAIEVKGISRWNARGIIADKFNYGRVILAGDAAHRHPPTTGLGLNSAIQDAYNLAWKLSLVLTGKASTKLLESYETERHAQDEHNVNWAMLTYSNLWINELALGLVPGFPEYTARNFQMLFTDSSEGRSRRARAAEMINIHRMEMQAQNIDLGFGYPAGAFETDGAPLQHADPFGGRYVPTTRPGHRLPHAWVYQGEERVSTLDLGSLGGFTLIVGRDGQHWQDAVQAVGLAYGVAIKAVQIAKGAGEYVDRDGTWHGVREVSDSGVVLVRPDNVVGWRSVEGRQDCKSVLSAVIGKILGKDFKAV